jgi:putative N6-adenine-specific DNA methylase
MRRFFVGCNVHFESELELELREVWPYLIELDGRPHANALDIVEVVPGGLLLQAPLHIGLQLNYFLKTANRILLRVKEFKARDFPKLFQQIGDLKKDPFFKTTRFQYQVAASESRLNNEKRILQILNEVLGKEDAESQQSLYVRMYQDLCSISLDTSGTHLHKRTERLSQGAAPLRETLAAFCARRLIGDQSAIELREIELIDPMCGTGTLLREAATLYQPTLRDDFSFLQWSATPKILKSAALKSNYPEMPRLFKSLRAADLDPEAVERARSSLQNLGGPVRVDLQDLFQQRPLPSDEERWVLSNPPYGERLRADFEPRQLFTQLDKVYRPTRMGLIVSERQASALMQVTGLPLKLENNWSFQNGGIKVQFLLFSRLLQES